MTNGQNFKKGDKVYMSYDPTISGIITDVCDDGKYDYYVKEDGAECTQGCYEYELLDRRTAFLTRLQSLLREFDAVIDIAADYGYSVGLSLRLNGEEVIHDRAVTELHADNIMDFDKE